jgi:hypothetical protein
MTTRAPAARIAGVSVATPRNRGRVPAAAPSMVKVTVPVGTPTTAAVTVAVKVTGSP